LKELLEMKGWKDENNVRIGLKPSHPTSTASYIY